MLYTWTIRKLLIQCPTGDWSVNWLATVSEEKYFDGLSQGSVLCPIIFVICINDMANGRHQSFQRDERKQDCDSVQNDLNVMQLWTDIWFLRFPPQKLF